MLLSSKKKIPPVKIYRNLMRDIGVERNQTLKTLLQREAQLLLRVMTDSELEEVESMAPEGSLEFQGFSVGAVTGVRWGNLIPHLIS